MANNDSNKVIDKNNSLKEDIDILVKTIYKAKKLFS